MEMTAKLAESEIPLNVIPNTWCVNWHVLDVSILAPVGHANTFTPIWLPCTACSPTHFFRLHEARSVHDQWSLFASAHQIFVKNAPMSLMSWSEHFVSPVWVFWFEGQRRFSWSPVLQWCHMQSSRSLIAMRWSVCFFFSVLSIGVN